MFKSAFDPTKFSFDPVESPFEPFESALDFSEASQITPIGTSLKLHSDFENTFEVVAFILVKKTKTPLGASGKTRLYVLLPAAIQSLKMSPALRFLKCI